MKVYYTECMNITQHIKPWSIKVGLGVLVWLIPFVAAVGLYTPEGALRVDLLVFKALMYLIGNTTGLVCFYWYFKRYPKNPVKTGLQLGLIWMVVNWALDALILIPLSNATPVTYFSQIGLVYFTMPITGYIMGNLLQQAQNRRG